MQNEAKSALGPRVASREMGVLGPCHFSVDANFIIF